MFFWKLGTVLYYNIMTEDMTVVPLVSTLLFDAISFLAAFTSSSSAKTDWISEGCHRPVVRWGLFHEVVMLATYVCQTPILGDFPMFWSNWRELSQTVARSMSTLRQGTAARVVQIFSWCVIKISLSTFHYICIFFPLFFGWTVLTSWEYGDSSSQYRQRSMTECWTAPTTQSNGPFQNVLLLLL